MNKNYEELFPEIKKNKDGSENKHSKEQRKRINSIISILENYENEKYYLHHYSIQYGQMARTGGCVINEYYGKYGRGLIIDVPWFKKGSKYHYRYYYIERRSEDGVDKNNDN